MRKPLIVGLCGFAQSGKDTLANLLVETKGYERRAFADIMREMLLKVNPLILGNPTEGAFHPTRLSHIVAMHGWDEAKQLEEVRSLLQRIGTEAGREILGEDVWVNALFSKPIVSSLVISDVRFPNEAKKIHDENGFIIRIIRDGVQAPNNHISEFAYSEQDYVIYNDSSPTAMLEAFTDCIEDWYGNA